MRSQNNARMTLTLSNREDLIAAKSTVQERSSSSIESIGLLITDPRLLEEDSAPTELNSFISQSLKSLLPNLEEVRLAIRGPGKLAEEEEEGANTIKADIIADLLINLSSLRLPLSLELSVAKLEGSLHRLANVLQDNQHVFRVVLHNCDNEEDDRHQGLLPIIDALSQCKSLQTLILEAIQLPVGDITANVLAQLTTHDNLERLELKHCIDLGDEELVPLVQSLSTRLKHFKLSTGLGLQQAHLGRQWGNGVVSALATQLAASSKEENSLTSLALTTFDAQVSFRPIVRAMQCNTSLQRLHLHNGSSQNRKNKKLQLGQDLIEILSGNHNMTLQHCNNLGLGFAEAAPLQFYTRLNQLNRKQLLSSYASNKEGISPWMSILLEHSQDHRIAHYLLSHNPTLLPAAARVVDY